MFRFLFLTYIFANTIAQTVIVEFNIDKKQSPDRTYCNVNLTQDHLGWSISQPHEEWVNITFNVTQDYIQITPYDEYGHIDYWGQSYYIIGWSFYPPYSMIVNVNYWGPYINLFYFTSPANCKRVKPTIKYGNHV